MTHCFHKNTERVTADSPYCYEDCTVENCGGVEAKRCLDCRQVLYRTSSGKWLTLTSWERQENGRWQDAQGRWIYPNMHLIKEAVL